MFFRPVEMEKCQLYIILLRCFAVELLYEVELWYLTVTILQRKLQTSYCISLELNSTFWDEWWNGKTILWSQSHDFLFTNLHGDGVRYRTKTVEMGLDTSMVKNFKINITSKIYKEKKVTFHETSLSILNGSDKTYIQK